MGGGFTPRAPHNIIEPLLLGKPVLTGPEVWTIEFPFAEAEAAGLARRLPDRAALVQALSAPEAHDAAAIARFLNQHTGGTARTLAAVDKITGRRA